MAQRHTGRFLGALALLAVFLPLTTLAGCKLFNKEKKQFGEDCQSDDDCESLECGTYGSVCTKACTYDRECGAGFVCRARDAGRPGDVCAKPTGVPNGQACNNAAECQSGNCLKPVGQSDATGFCSLHCETDADCPDGHKVCQSISDSGATKFCLPGGGDSGGSADLPGAGQEPPKFVAPRPITTTVAPVTTTSTTTTTPTTTTTSVAAPTTSQTSPIKPPTTASATTTTSSTTTTRPVIKRPVVIRKPK